MLPTWHRLALLAAAIPTLSGCAVAVPVVAASVIARKQLGYERVRSGAAAGVRGREGRVIAPSAIAMPTPLIDSVRYGALPAPTPTAGPVASFVDYAVAQARLPLGERRSMILAPGASLDRVAFTPCDETRPTAVLIDEDVAAAAGLREALARLRAADVQIIWMGHPAAAAAAVPDVTASGSAAGMRKQQLRFEASQAYCVVALAGSRRGDADELYDYLRTPDAALPLDRYWGEGWFLLPPVALAGAKP